MYQLSHNITIEKPDGTGTRYRLKMVDEVHVVKAIDALSDTAVIKVPGTVLNKAFDIESKVSVGDVVNIELGYDGDLRGEFYGYVDRIGTDGGVITIECIDALYLFKKKTLQNKQYKGVGLKRLLAAVCDEVSPLINVDCDYDVTYDTFTIFKATGYDVLSKVQDEIKANIFFSGRTLHVHAPYKYSAGGTAIYDFGRNVESSDLKYVRAKDKKIEVELTVYEGNGKSHKVTYGTTGGEKVSRTSVTVDDASAKKMAKEEYEAMVFDGYEGSISGWLLPYVNPGYSVELKDKDYPDKDGKYYVVGVDVSFSRQGGVRRVTLGRKIN